MKTSKQQSEAEKVKMLLGDFVAKESKGEKLLNVLLNDERSLKRTKASLHMLCQFFAAQLGIKSVRNEKRHRDLCVMFFDTHYDEIVALMEKYKYTFESVSQITGKQSGDMSDSDNVEPELPPDPDVPSTTMDDTYMFQ